jgi:hypothetical protein
MIQFPPYLQKWTIVDMIVMSALTELIRVRSHPDLVLLICGCRLFKIENRANSRRPCAAWSRSTLRRSRPISDEFDLHQCCGRNWLFFASWRSSKFNQGEHHVDILQESRAYLRSSCSWCGALRNADFSRTFGNIRHCVVY